METKDISYLNVTSKSGKTFPVHLFAKVVETDRGVSFFVDIDAFGVQAHLEEVQGSRCLVIPQEFLKKSKIGETFPGAKTNARACIPLIEESLRELTAEIEEIKAPFRAEDEKKKAIIKAEEDAVEHKLVHRFGVNWGDYTTTSYCNIMRVRKLTVREISESNWQEGTDISKLYKAVEFISDVDSGGLTEQVRERATIGNLTHGGCEDLEDLIEISEEEARQMLAEFSAIQEKKEAERIEKENKKAVEREIQKEKEKAERADIEENELFIFDAKKVYASAGGRMIHSLGANFSDKQISVYTTSYARMIPNANTTQSTSVDLKKMGFEFDGESKTWRIDSNEHNVELTIAYLKTYDTKAWPASLGLVRCWECGGYFRPKHGEDYCGC